MEQDNILGNGDKWGSQTPHTENIVTCKCGHRYCRICHSKCPKCGGVHLSNKPVWWCEIEGTSYGKAKSMNVR
jgi:hypothetical protein